MKIAFNPSTVAALTTPPNNKDITFDLRGRNIFARGVKFYGTDTNTWRDIKINNVSIGSHTLDLQNGSNTTLTNTNGVVTINSTWRPVVDNLTSDSTTSSLSAKQGKVLKALIDGKSNSDHNHDGRYVRYYAVTTLDCNNLAAGLTSARISATNAAHTNHSAYLYISDVGTPFQIQIPDSGIPYIYKRYYGSGEWSGWFKLNAGYADSAGSVAWANVTGKPSSYTPSAHTHDGRYLRLSGQDTMQGNLYLHSHGTSYIGKGLGDKSGADFTEANIVIRSWWGISFKSYDDIVRTYIDTRTGNIGTKGVLNAVGAVIQGRVYNGGDDEGIIINPAPNGYAGLILGTHNGERSVFYLKKGNPFWRYNNGSTNLDIYHPKKSGTIALTSDIPNKDSWNYDDRYLRLTGGWMSGDINFGGDNKIYWKRNTDSASISFKNDGDWDADSYMSFVTSDNGNEYFRWSHSSGSTNTEWMALRSDGLRVRGTKVSLEGHTHNDLYYTKAESNAKYITDIATSVNKLTFTRNGSNIARNITVNVVYSQGNLTDISNKDNTTKASSGLYIYNSYNQVIGTNSYSSVLSINTGGTIQIAGNWGDEHARNLYWRSQSDRNVADYPWKSWRTILDSENYSSTLDSRYYTESEVNSLLDAKLNRQNLSYGNWNPRGYHLAADYHYNGGDLSISENNGKMYVSVDGCFWQNEGQYRVLDTSDISDIRGSLTLSQYLSATDAAWYPLVWGGNAHINTSDSTGPVYKSYDKLSWQTSSQTLYATNIQTNNIKNLSIGGGIYWNPNVESATDGSNAASITLVRSGVAGGTTLVLSQMNDTNDTIQFKTNTAARLYHNSYPILTTQNTYVSNNKGYINGTEITQVNYARSAGNADTVDGQHASAFSYKSWWHWYGKDGQPNWLWGGNNENDYYVYNPSNFRVAYAASAGNAYTLDGYPANGSNDRPYGHIPTIESDGVMEVGKYIDFHNDNNGKHDFSTRLQSTGNYGNEVNLPSASGTLALINDVNNYYWANVKISTSSSTTTSPTFSNVYLGNRLYLPTGGANSIYTGPNDSANGVGGPLNNLVFSSWYGMSFTTSCAGMTYTNKNAVSINCRTGQLYAREVQANGFMHTGHNNNDAVLLAGGGYKTLEDFIFLNKSYNYTDSEHYNLKFHKLSGICNNLVWVDGHVKGSVATFFVIDPAVFPYRYDEDPNLNTIYLMSGKNYITINAIGIVTINNATDHEQRVGFFYTGRA